MKFAINIKGGKLDPIVNIAKSDFDRLNKEHTEMYELLKEVSKYNIFDNWEKMKQLLKEIES